MTQDQQHALRKICERLAFLAGGSLPPMSDSLEDTLVTLNALTEMLSRKISRGRQDQEELREIRHELDNVERLKARFIKNVSHELRTPLACIDGFARALLKMEEQAAKGEPPAVQAAPPADETRQQFLRIISQEAQRLSHMVEEVLQLSDIESQRRRREPALFSAEELFADAINAFQPQRGVSNVVVRLKEGQSPAIYADRNAMVDVLRELLGNAHKFSGGKEIALGAERVTIGPDRSTQASDSGLQHRVSSATQIYVKDQGIGISQEDLPHIFEKFYRAESVANLYPGTGLGLAIARSLVLQDNGQIWCTSSPGAGATFHILLPDRPPGAQ